jgi:hypothetical protein
MQANTTDNEILVIPQPCHVNWQAMSPTEQGRFCQSCQKQVIDFTNMTDAQILALIPKNNHAVCGRFNTEQLNRPLGQQPPIFTWQKIMKLAASVLAFLCLKTPAKAQGEPMRWQKDSSQYQISATPSITSNNAETSVIEGRVLATDSLDLSTIKITVEALGITAHPDATGYFKIVVPNKDLTPITIINFSCKRHFRETRSLHKQDFGNGQLLIEMRDARLYNPTRCFGKTMGAPIFIDESTPKEAIDDGPLYKKEDRKSNVIKKKKKKTD